MPRLWQLIVGIGVVVGLATGVGTVVDSIAGSKSLADAAPFMLKVAGVVYIELFFIGAGLLLLVRPHWTQEGWARKLGIEPVTHPFRIGLLLLVFGGFLTARLVFPFSEKLSTWGAAGLVGTFVGTLRWLWDWIRDYGRSRKTCPDCAETIKINAKVCHYCGFRFAPKPPTPYNETAQAAVTKTQ